MSVGDDEVLRRTVRRDVAAFGSVDEVLRRYRRRYLPAQRLYRERWTRSGMPTSCCTTTIPGTRR